MIRKLLSACTLLLLCSFAAAQDPALLRPPKGAQVALVVFQDLECPKCRIDSPLEEQAARAHKIPLVLHDFPLPLHKWSFNAAVIARYFDGRQFTEFRAEVRRRPQSRPAFCDRSARQVCRGGERGQGARSESRHPAHADDIHCQQPQSRAPGRRSD